MKPENRYQYINNNFFKIIKDRKLHLSEAFLLIYLRGLAVFFNKPTFEWNDKQILEDLGTSHSNLSYWRSILKTKGLIDYKTNNSQYVLTQYTMLDTIVAEINSVSSILKTQNSVSNRMPSVSNRMPPVSNKCDTLLNKSYRVIKEKDKSYKSPSFLISSLLKPKTTKKPETNEEYLKRINDRRNLLQKQAIEMGVKL